MTKFGLAHRQNGDWLTTEARIFHQFFLESLLHSSLGTKISSIEIGHDAKNLVTQIEYKESTGKKSKTKAFIMHLGNDLQNNDNGQIPKEIVDKLKSTAQVYKFDHSIDRTTKEVKVQLTINGEVVNKVKTSPEGPNMQKSNAFTLTNVEPLEVDKKGKRVTYHGESKYKFCL